MAATVQCFEHARGGDRAPPPAVDDAHRAKCLLQLARMRRSVLADVGEDSLRKSRMRFLDVPRIAHGTRVKQAKRVARQDSVDVDELLGQRERRIVFLEIASAIAENAMPQDQVLRPRRRADRIELHESQRPNRAFEIARGKEGARNRILAKLLQRNAGRTPAHADLDASSTVESVRAAATLRSCSSGTWNRCSITQLSAHRRS